jgi:aspartyl-tRNA(Asn)/glutamyl-tRNA(Gln) amidotransferase subunit B
VQETRLWDASARETFSMRSKEDAHDYRYFPEPDLPPVRVARDRIEQIRESIAELPEARRRRVMVAYALSDAEVTALENIELTPLFEETARASGQPRAAFNWVSGEVARKLNELGERFDRQRVTASALAGLIALVEKATISASIGKTVLEKMYDTGRTAEDIVASDGLAQIGDENAILSSVRAVIESNQDAVGQIRNGKTGTFGFLVGQVMKATGGKANPKLVNELLRRELNI